MYCGFSLEYVKDGGIDKAIWNHLCSNFEPKSTSSKLYLLKRMLTLKFLVRFDDLLRLKKSAGCRIGDAIIACLLLCLL